MKNRITELSQRLQDQLKDYGFTFVSIDEYGELVARSEYTPDYSFYEAIEAEIQELDLKAESENEARIVNLK